MVENVWGRKIKHKEELIRSKKRIIGTKEGERRKKKKEKNKRKNKTAHLYHYYGRRS
jgi:hypothetical protein